MYRELPPSARLRANVACLWFQRVGERPYRHLVVPDGCADIISIAGQEPFVVGPTSKPVLVDLPPDGLVVGARFRPGRALAALGVRADELLDLEVPLADVWG